MRRLILLRHAKSSSADDGLGDHGRRLSARGERDAPRMGDRLRRRGATPDAIVTSTAWRALRTATLVAEALRYPEDRIRLEDSLYLASPEAILAVIAAQDNALDCLLVVGHNPGFTELVNRLLPTLDLDNLPTGGLVAIDCDAAGWAQLPTARRRLAYYDFPKNPDAPVRAD